MNTMSLPAPVRALMFASMGALATAMLISLWEAALNAEQPVLWWVTRASGFVAYVALALSVFFGVMISSKGAGGLLPKKVVMDLHQQWTLSAVVASVVHVLSAVLHVESGISAWAAIIPFASENLTGAVGIGTVAFLGLGVIAASSWLRTLVPYGAWRAIHALAFGVMILALAHSVAAGTDTVHAAARWTYIATAAAILGAITIRLLVALAGRGTEPRRN